MSEPATEIVDSPRDWVKRHIDNYVATDGAEGQTFQGAPALLLTTVGRKSGTRRRTALIYNTFGDDHLVVASKGGAPKHPAWYLNLVANPDVELQVGAETFPARAETLAGDERRAGWARMIEVWPAYDEYRQKTDREIPVVRLRRQT